MRPLVHFTADAGWINDPHGLTFHRGRYHLFHQYVPESMVWAPNCHWGHATSSNLLTWTRHRVAIAPGDGDDGIWTGSLALTGQDATILYTSVAQPDLGLGRVRLATPADDSWEIWSKGDIVVTPPDELDLIAFRDPFVVRDAAGWRMFIGAATREGDALALTYTSPDLSSWIYEGIALQRSTKEKDPVWMGALWECPQVFEVDDHWVMVSSVWDNDVLHYAGYALGDRDSYSAGKLMPTEWGQLSFGDSYYAPSYFLDEDELPCLMFWMRGVSDADDGWASCLSLPYSLTVRDDRLVAEPHAALAEARGDALAAGADARAYDLEWDPTASQAELVLASDLGKSATLRATEGRIHLERPGVDAQSMPWPGGPVRVVVDGPVLEVSCAGGLLGGPIAPATRWDGPAEACSAWRLAID
ncbi:MULTISPECIES: glycoside hydrolase family 32 protein [unclassified Nocardioides]|uniref:glycoside hydrolase family 32 protein n=1 Tax=unclassified Nocardioides TaxID=2615069 RepID=UPI000056F854|nr:MULTISPECIES: glycoside hydrolase family 32 protein [unclassified Nocardioides]ABL79605.1 Glycosyl hydrolase family 32, N terminal domain protein [Nocardioides sp. JS614]